MPVPIADLMLGFVMPAVIVIVSGLVRKRILAGRLPDSVHGALETLTVVVAFAAGYSALKLGPVWPEIDRDWLYFSAVAAIPATLIALWKESLVRRFVFCVLVAAGVIALMLVLVPDWESLDDRRSFLRLTWGFAMLASALTGLGGKTASRRIAQAPEREGESDAESQPHSATLISNGTFVWLPIVATAAPLAALGGSIVFAMITVCLLGSLTGLALDTVINRGWSVKASTNISVISAFVVGSVMFTVYVNTFSQIPQTLFWLLPLVSIVPTIILRSGGSTPSWRRTLVSGLIGCLACGLLLGWAVAAEWEALTEPDLY